ncbi:MAG: hypothetical protein U5L00_08410 [Desulfovermiculus sp.]|nr:hypothetical protein [Desulfovermiculus sp.]
MIRTLILSLLALVWAGTGLCAQQTELLDLRLGVHDGASRAVFACRGPRPQFMGPLSNATYRIGFSSLALPPKWKPSRLPQDTFFTRIQTSKDESVHSVILHTTREDVWVEEVVLKEDDRPGHYQLILDFWPLSQEKVDPENKTLSSFSPQPSAEDEPEEPVVISSLSQGERMPVRTDIVLEPDHRPREEAQSEPRITHVTGFRVGEHPGYTRVVVEAWGPSPAAIPEVDKGILRIGFQHISLHIPGEVMNTKAKGLLQGVNIEPDCICLDVQADARTKQAVILDSDPPRPGAYRLVLDLKSTHG